MCRRSVCGGGEWMEEKASGRAGLIWAEGGGRGCLDQQLCDLALAFALTCPGPRRKATLFRCSN